MTMHQPTPLNLPAPSVGSASAFKLPWAAFVQIVLEITIEAYQRMRQDRVARQTWEEDVFSLKLTEDYIEPIARNHPLNLMAFFKTKDFTPEMKTGVMSPKAAPEIDIRIFTSWERPSEIYFAWECKLIAGRKPRGKYNHLIGDYITDGIFRFVDEKYSANLDDAGMLGSVDHENASTPI